MSYIDSNLVPGERVAYETRLHWIVMIGHLLIAVVFLALTGALLYYGAAHRDASGAIAHWVLGLGTALAVCGLAILFAGVVRRSSTEMAVTTRRVVVKQGLLSRSTIEMLLNKVESIEVRETLTGRLLGYGTVVLIGTGGSSEPFHNMAHPLEFRSMVQRQLESYRSMPDASAGSGAPLGR